MKHVAAAVLAIGVSGSCPAHALAVHWIDWVSSSYDTSGGFTAQGVITSGSSSVDVSYCNPLGVGFIQTGSGTDYFTSSTANSPYESTGPRGVDNRPPAAEMIALSRAGSQTLTFSTTVQNLYLAFVSLNGNGWRFDFQILSYTGGDLDGAGQDGAGYWGSGSVVRVDNGDGTYSLNNLTSGEPHGTILLTERFATLSWQSLNNEYWNGFTVGIEGTDDQVYDPDVDDPAPVPVPAAAWMLGTALLGGFGPGRLRRKA